MEILSATLSTPMMPVARRSSVSRATLFRMASRGCRMLTSSPLIHTLPEVWARRPKMPSISSVRWAPTRPATPRISPFFSSKLQWRKERGWMDNAVNLCRGQTSIMQKFPHQGPAFKLLMFAVCIAVFLSAERAGNVMRDSGNFQYVLRLSINMFEFADGLGECPGGIEGPFRENLDGYTGKLPWRGIGWYRKRFNIKNIDKDKMFFLDFDGVMANAEVYLNGKKIGERPYGYISFRVNLTPYIRFDSENIIAVRVDTEKLGSRWYPGAGIYRHVRLVKTNKLHIPQWGVFISTPEINSQYATASVMVQLANGKKKTARSSYTIEIFKLDKANIPRERVAVGAKENIKIAANAIDSSLVSLKVEKPQLWDLENTNLYL